MSSDEITDTTSNEENLEQLAQIPAKASLEDLVAFMVRQNAQARIDTKLRRLEKEKERKREDSKRKEELEIIWTEFAKSLQVH